MTTDADDWKRLFLDHEALTLSVNGAIQRASVYSEATEQQRKEFRDCLRDSLDAYAQDYRGAVGEHSHIANILSLAADMERNHKGILSERRFRFGPAQKALNLYLKYLWCLGDIPEPPHCPFDLKIITHLGSSIRWTKMTTIGQYKQLVEKARSRAGKKSLARWELEVFLRLNQ